MKWIVWAVLLILQQFAHALSQRAKNSDRYLYNAWAGVFSNGVWICSNFILVDNIVQVMRGGDFRQAAFIGVFYTSFCTIGSLLGQWAAINFFERKNGILRHSRSNHQTENQHARNGAE